jgi:hypothetical protein
MRVGARQWRSAGDAGQACLKSRSLTVCREAGDKRGEVTLRWFARVTAVGHFASARALRMPCGLPRFEIC